MRAQLRAFNVFLVLISTVIAISVVAAVPQARADVVSERRHGRTLDLKVQSAAMKKTMGVRLLVPPGWSENATRRWPVLWLLHGGGDDYRSWTSHTDVEQLAAKYQVIVVMPEGGRCGNYSDWRSGGANWETFHMGELRELLKSRYRAGDAAAIAGNSMGGFGAMSYAARHQGFFKAAASFSGTLDSLLKGHVPSGPLFMETTTALACLGSDPYDVWGDSQDQRDVWEAHNPTSQAARLNGVSLFVSSGNGKFGPLDKLGTPDLVLEPQTLAESRSFVKALNKANVPAKLDFYGKGTHSWPYWQRELHRAFPMLMKRIGA
ncbi:esterase family protein [Actinomadura barringtoniae]|uniref:Esterase family protein n=1 Tax=Actinomadura barringtoniae TaxID=1427535 RepID=A0A939PNR5_9ACTN|nr:alpha/beta hydrolase family protein [Actinomadura barringtoniae]MBO2455398.1 esterase family protein [Actinomadura barringtoniae]